MDILRLSGVYKNEGGNDTVSNVSFTQRPLEKLAIAGETGSGKTTLLKLIGGLLQPDSGTIIFEEKRVRGPNDQLIPGHAGIAYLSQHFELRNNYWVYEILSYANQLTHQEADELYRICRIDHLLHRRTDQLSGGERQRIALARLLISSPRLLLLDEPFSNLDATHRQLIRSVIDDINERLSITCIMVSHDPPDVLPWADNILVMKAGTIVQSGAPEAIYRQPTDEYCAGLFGDYTIVEPLLAKQLVSPHRMTAIEHGRLLVRPEDFQVTEEKNSIRSIISEVHFMGSFYRLKVLADGQPLTVRTHQRGLVKGQMIYLAMEEDAGHFIS